MEAQTTWIKINLKNGRVTFFSHAFWTYKFFQNKKGQAIGFDLFYCAETSELLFEKYEHNFNTVPETKNCKRKELAEIGATLWLKKDNSINIQRYFKKIPELKKLHLALNDTEALDESNKISKTFEAKVVGSDIRIKLDDSKKEAASRSSFQKLQLKRIKNSKHEILLDTLGYLRLPHFTLEMGKRVKIDISTEEEITLKFGVVGDRALKKDATLNIKTILRDAGIRVSQKLYLPYYIEGDKIIFSLKSSDPKKDLQALRNVSKALGLM